MTLVVAVAPGARHTAVVLRSDDTLRGHQVVDRRDVPLDWYLGDVVDAVTKLKERARNIILQDTPAYIGNPAVLAVSDLLRDVIAAGVEPELLLTRAQVIGAVAGHWITHRVTEPVDVHPLSFYPDNLQHHSPRGRQARLAWDVAGHVIDVDREEATT